MDNDRNNMSAFPVIPPSNDAAGFPFPESGMTLRDYFAAKAMQALIGNLSVEGNVVSNAYWIADRMMEERSK